MKKANVNYKILANNIPAGATVIDTVKTDAFPIGAVLIQFDNGMYALLSDRKISSCDQVEAKRYVNSMNTDKTNLRKLREKCGLTQSKLSEMSGVNIRTLKSYDSGERNINGASCGTVKALADVLKCQIEDLMETEPEEEAEEWFTVVDDGGAEVDLFSFNSLEEAKEKADSIYNHLTGYEIRNRSGLYVLKTDGPDEMDGDTVYTLI